MFTPSKVEGPRPAAHLTRPASIPPPHEPPTARFLSPFIFITLQIPIPANPLYSHPYKTPGVSPSSIAHPRFSPPLPLCSSVACLLGHVNAVFSFSCALFISLAALFSPPVLCFQSFARSFTKTPGWGVGQAVAGRRDDLPLRRDAMHQPKAAQVRPARSDGWPKSCSPRTCDFLYMAVMT